jgi:hypothetical protein
MRFNQLLTVLAFAAGLSACYCLCEVIVAWLLNITPSELRAQPYPLMIMLCLSAAWGFLLAQDTYEHLTHGKRRQ